MTEILKVETPACAFGSPGRKQDVPASRTSRLRTVTLRFYVLLAFFPVLSCAQSLDADIPSSVLNSGHERQVIATKDGKRLQVTRKVTIPYPKTAVSESDYQALSAGGWKRCSSANESWNAMLELEEKRVIHQITHYWTKGGRLLTINMRYMTPSDTKPPADLPGSDIQAVTVLVDEFGVLLDDILAKLHIKC